MSLNQEKLEKCFELWMEYAKSCFEKDSDAFIAHLKRTLDDFLSEKATELDEAEKGAVKARIEELLQDRKLLWDVLDLVPREGAELRSGYVPIPGYTLTRPLGNGGYGEVWLATAPGGIEVALKFLPKTSFGDEFTSKKELEALQNIKNIRHVNLVPLSVIWEEENLDYIIYQMALSNDTLSKRLYVEEQLEGIAADVLLPYFRDIAAALDYLNHPGSDAPHPAIMHGDVKPENIFVMENRALLGDFGSARVLDPAGKTLDGSYTPAFVAPERLDGKIHRNSDQYSLAASWYYLRTGCLLCSEAPMMTVSSVSTEWLNSLFFKTLKSSTSESDFARKSPDFSALSSHERKELTRALALNPEERFASSSDFIEALAHKRRVFPWIALVSVILVMVGIYVYSQNLQEKKAQREFLTASDTVSMQMAAQFLMFKGMSETVEDMEAEWRVISKKCDENPERQDEYLASFARILKGKAACWKELTKEPLAVPSEVTLKTLQKNGVKIEEIDVLYTQMNPWVVDEFFGYLRDMGEYSRWYVQGDGMRRLGKANMDMLYLSYNYSVDLYYCSYLEWLTSMPKGTQKQSREFLAQQQIAFCDHLATNLTEQEYSDKREALYQEMTRKADALDEIVDQVGAEFEILKAQAEESQISVWELREKQEELASRKQKLQEAEVKILEACVFQEDDSPWLMWGKVLRVAKILQLKLESKGVFPHEEVYALLQQKLDDLAQRCAADTVMVHGIQVAKRYYQGVVEGKIPCYGRMAYLFENSDVHPNLQSGDIVTEVNGHSVRNKKETDASWNSAEGAENVLTRLRFDESGDPVIEKCTVPPGAPKIGYIELWEENE